MNPRALLLAFLAVLACAACAHLTMPLLAFEWFIAGGTVLVLLERITTTVMHTGWGCVPIAREHAAW